MTGTSDQAPGTDESVAQAEVAAGEQGLLFDDELSPLPGDVGYRGPTACKAAGITYRQLDYWARTGLVEPTVRGASGSGSSPSKTGSEASGSGATRTGAGSGSNPTNAASNVKAAAGSLVGFGAFMAAFL